MWISEDESLDEENRSAHLVLVERLWVVLPRRMAVNHRAVDARDTAIIDFAHHQVVVFLLFEQECLQQRKGPFLSSGTNRCDRTDTRYARSTC